MRRPKPADTRATILETAKTLMRRFGGDKMTVVDIARAMDMSHANVYRFFKTKSEILDAIVDDWLAKVEEFVEAIAQRPEPASARIEAVVLELHRKRRQKLLKEPELYETYRRVAELRPDMLARRRQKILDVFRRLLDIGMETGEFERIDSQQMATVLKDATALFLHPMMIQAALHERTETRGRDVVRAILAGFTTDGAKRRELKTGSKTEEIGKRVETTDGGR